MHPRFAWTLLMGIGLPLWVAVASTALAQRPPLPAGASVPRSPSPTSQPSSAAPRSPASQPSAAATQPAVAPGQTGALTLRFESPSPLASADECRRRFAWQQKASPMTLADETFFATVPDDYVNDGSWGLFVFISASPRGTGCPPDWATALKAHKLIWIAADKSGNQREVDHRIRLAVEAALQMQSRYALDKRRIYVAGMSGGSKVAAMSELGYGDVFSGVFCMCGTAFYRNIPTGEPKHMYPLGLPAPPANILNAAKHEHRQVLLSGDKDFNLAPTKQFYVAGYQREKFEHVTLLIVPDMGHQPPPAEWLEKGLVALDTIPQPKGPRYPAGVAKPK